MTLSEVASNSKKIKVKNQFKQNFNASADGGGKWKKVKQNEARFKPLFASFVKGSKDMV